MTTWDGRERRRNNNRNVSDHDLLTRIDEKLEGFNNIFLKHVADDDANFKDINSRLKIIERAYYIGLGVLVFIQFLTRR